MFPRKDRAIFTAGCHDYAKISHHKFSWQAVRSYLLALVIFTFGFAAGSVTTFLYWNGSEIETAASISPTNTALPGFAIATPSLETSSIAIDTLDLPSSTPEQGNTATITPAPIVYIVYTRAGTGVNLRAAPSGKLVQVLPNGTEVILLPEEGVQQNGHIWLYVQTLDGKLAGWVAESLLMRK